MSFEQLKEGVRFEGDSFNVSRETIREFCEASLDFNPLHLDDNYMQGNFGRTNFGGIIMHGMTNFGVLTRMLTSWAYDNNAIHRRLETRWKSPVRPGDVITPQAQITHLLTTAKSRWATLTVEMRNQRDEVVAVGEAMVEFPLNYAVA